MKHGDTVYVTYLSNPGPRLQSAKPAKVLASDGALLTVEIDGRPPVILERVPKGERPVIEGPFWVEAAPLPVEVREPKGEARGLPKGRTKG